MELIIFVALTIALLLIELILWLRENKTEKIYHSWILWFTDLSYALLFISCLFEFFYFHRTLSLFISVIGGLISIFGLSLLFISARTLGKFFSGAIKIREGHKVIREGPYRFVRHPIYLGVGLLAIGQPLILNAYLSLGFTLLFIVSLLVKIKFEEAILLEKLGEAYKKYQREVPALIPRLR